MKLKLDKQSRNQEYSEKIFLSYPNCGVNTMDMMNVYRLLTLALKSKLNYMFMLPISIKIL